MNAPEPPPGTSDDASLWMQLKQQLKASLPTQADLERHRWLRPVAARLADQTLWRLQTEPVARGVGIGLFWAFAMPVAQILFAAAHCVWWRGNIPVAAGVTLITNPLTAGFWLWLAYQLGSWIVPASAGTPAPGPELSDGPWLSWISAFGLPTLVGLGSFALGGAVLGYGLTRLAGEVWVAWRWRRVAVRKQSRRRS